MDFINLTGSIGQIITHGTINITGNLVATLLLVLTFLIIVCIMFNIPLEFASVLLIPFCISVGAYYSSFMGPLIVIFIYVSTLIAKNWIFR